MGSGDSRLEGKVAMVTGAAQGIGRAIARRYAEEGAKVVLCDLNAEGANAAAEEIRQAGGEAFAVAADVSSSAGVDRLFDEAVSTYSTVDVLVNNAAITLAGVRHVLEGDEAWWDEVLDVNLKGHYLCSLRAARIMAPKRSGVILMMSSGGATRAHRGMVAYDASKGGIEALTRALALDLGPYGIRVAALVPGLLVPSLDEEFADWIARNDATVPLGRTGVPEDMTGPAVFLASDDAAYVHGATLVVDGGVLVQQRPPQIESFPLSRFPKIDDVAAG